MEYDDNENVISAFDEACFDVTKSLSSCIQEEDLELFLLGLLEFLPKMFNPILFNDFLG